MAMNFTRRDMLKLAGGSALGFFFTPIPWKALDDLSIWTQNWSSIPKSLRGEIKTKYSVCALCPAGCAVRARCVGDQPVSLFGVPDHPISHGVLCPMGFTGHHLAYHPLRATQPLQLIHENDPVMIISTSLDAAVAAIADAMKSTDAQESVAILDQRPGRTTSLLFRQFLAELPNGIYLNSPSRESATLDALQDLFEKPYSPLGFDLENAKTILSFGAPILDGWGTPGRLVHLMKNQQQFASNKNLKIIQIETWQSRTALRADQWIPIKPGTEATFALGLAHVIIREKLFDEAAIRHLAKDFQSGNGHSYINLIKQFTPERVAELTGISAPRIVEIAREAAQHGPTLVVGGGDAGGGPLGKEEEIAIAGLNLLFGNVGKTGGILPRHELPVPSALSDTKTIPTTEFAEIADHSIRVLIMDGAESGNAIPWTLIEKKLVPEKALVVSLSPYLTRHAKRANYLIPAPAHLESLQEAPTPFDAASASFSLSVPLLTPPASVVEPVTFINHLANAVGISIATNPIADLLKSRVEAIYQTGRGRVFTFSDSQSVDITNIGSADQLLEMLNNGATWIDSDMKVPSLPRYSLLGKSSNGYQLLLAAGEGRLNSQTEMQREYPLVLMPFGWRGAVGNGQFSPVMSKLYQESGLRDLANQAFVNPETGDACGLIDGVPALIKTTSGSIKTEIHFDSAVMPGVVHVAVGPARNGAENVKNYIENILSICNLENDTTWRVTPAQIEPI